MRQHRPAFLREPRHVKDTRGEAVKVCGHRQHGADRHNPGSTNSRNEDGYARCANERLWIRQAGERGFDIDRRLTAQGGAANADERRAKPVRARVVLVATRLIDHALTPEFGLSRLDRHAVGRCAAVATSLAHEFVD